MSPLDTLELPSGCAVERPSERLLAFCRAEYAYYDAIPSSHPDGRRGGRGDGTYGEGAGRAGGASSFSSARRAPSLSRFETSWNIRT